MQRRNWNVSELAELLVAHGRMQDAYTTLMRDRVLTKTGVEIPKHPIGFGISETTKAHLCTRVARRLKEDDRTIPLYQMSEEEMTGLVTECMAEGQREHKTDLTLQECDSLKQSLVQTFLGMSVSEEDPAINYAATWQWIDAVERWAVQHKQAPLAFFDQSDAHGELTRRTKSKERFLSEGYLGCNSPGKLEQAKRIVLEPVLALVKSEGPETPAQKAFIEEVTTAISTSIAEQMRRTYEEIVADADRIYGTDTPALPS